MAEVRGEAIFLRPYGTQFPVLVCIPGVETPGYFQGPLRGMVASGIADSPVTGGLFSDVPPGRESVFWACTRR